MQNEGKVLVVPDVHGRTFWTKVINEVDNFDRIIFLGDYLDQYNFEQISSTEAIENFKRIIEFKKENEDNVILLLGNHDLPYFSETYYELSSWHCRHDIFNHGEICKLFSENKNFFKIAHVEEDIIFTHSGIESEWLREVVMCNSNDINIIGMAINSLIHPKLGKMGLRSLFKVTAARGGSDRCPSCVWADINEMLFEQLRTQNPDDSLDPILKMKQVFGHTIQAKITDNNKIVFGKPIEKKNIKMLDCAKVFILDINNFTITQL